MRTFVLKKSLETHSTVLLAGILTKEGRSGGVSKRGFLVSCCDVGASLLLFDNDLKVVVNVFIIQF